MKEREKERKKRERKKERKKNPGKLPGRSTTKAGVANPLPGGIFLPFKHF
jgi:hypothetical protein